MHQLLYLSVDDNSFINRNDWWRCTREQLPLVSSAEPLGHSGVPLKSPLPPCETIGLPDCLISRPYTFTYGLQLYSPYLLILQWGAP